MNKALFPILLVIITIAAFFMWINPRYENVKVLKVSMNESDSALASVKELEDTKKRLEAKENSFKQEDLVRLQKLLPDNVDNIRWFLDVQGVASRYSTSIQNLSIGNQGQAAQKTTTASTKTQAIGPSSKTYGQMVLSFSINISYENLILFLKDLERDLRIVEIKSLSFSADNKTPNRYQVAIAINAFWLNPKQ